MKWNWQQKDWPNFHYDQSKLLELEKQFMREIGTFSGAFSHLGEEARLSFKIEHLSLEALKTSEIEGEYLHRESVQYSIKRYMKIDLTQRKIPLAEQGIAEMMVHLFAHFKAPLTHETLFRWHQMIMKGRRDLLVIGKYRQHEEPMQILSGPVDSPHLHFQAPPSRQVFVQMEKFILWYNQAMTGVDSAMVRAGIAHLYFESIHPFEDGNGRIGRAIAEKMVSQLLGEPIFLSLSQIIEKNKKDYYRALEEANKSNEITSWLIYFSQTLISAQKESSRFIAFLIEKIKFFDAIKGKIHSRQEKALLRMFEEGPDGFKGGMSAEKYIAITKTSRASATRDLQQLVQMGIFEKKGERKSTRYFLKH